MFPNCSRNLKFKKSVWIFIYLSKNIAVNGLFFDSVRIGKRKKKRDGIRQKPKILFKSLLNLAFKINYLCSKVNC